MKQTDNILRGPLPCGSSLQWPFPINSPWQYMDNQDSNADHVAYLAASVGRAMDFRTRGRTELWVFPTMLGAAAA